MKKIIFAGSLAVVLTAGANMSASAALASNAVLNFDPGVLAHVGSGSHGLSIVSGSYFGLDTNASGRVGLLNESVPVLQDDGIFIGQTQLANGSHGGRDGPSTGGHGIDLPWSFFGASGQHQTTSPINILTDDGAGNVTIDFSGWSINWKGISNIPLGGGIQDCGTASDGICIDPIDGADISGVFDNGTGVATIVCALDCAAGDTYTLDYAAVLPQDDPSFFGGVLYNLHLEGTISSVPVPAAVWLFGSGLLGLAGVTRRRKA